MYRLQLYLEPVDSDVSKYYFEVNGSPVSSSAANNNVMRCYVSKSVEMTDVRDSDEKPAASASVAHVYSMPDCDDVALKVLNVLEVRLNKWDMVLVRRKPNWIGKYGGRTAFGRLLLQAM